MAGLSSKANMAKDAKVGLTICGLVRLSASKHELCLAFLFAHPSMQVVFCVSIVHIIATSLMEQIKLSPYHACV